MLTSCYYLLILLLLAGTPLPIEVRDLEWERECFCIRSLSTLALGIFFFLNGRDFVREVKDLGEGYRLKERDSSSALGGESGEI